MRIWGNIRTLQTGSGKPLLFSTASAPVENAVTIKKLKCLNKACTGFPLFTREFKAIARNIYASFYRFSVGLALFEVTLLDPACRKTASCTRVDGP